MKITFVKKVIANGDPCPKCKDVEKRLRKSGYLDYIDEVVIADERNPDSSGMLLAKTHGVNLAPFFIVEDNGATRLHTVYLKFIKEEFDDHSKASAKDAEETLRSNPDLDFI